MITVAQRNVRGVNTPWLLWHYCGFIDKDTWQDHVGQLLVCCGKRTVRPSVKRIFRVLNSRSRHGDDLSVVEGWDGTRLDEKAPVYVIPPMNLNTWWFPYTFEVSPARKKRRWGIPPGTIRKMQRADEDIFARILT